MQEGMLTKQAVIVALVVLVTFSRILGFDFVTYDDDLFVLHQAVSNWGGLSWSERFLTPHIGYPIPGVVAVFALIHAVVGFTPPAFHFASLLLHGINAVLVLLIGRRFGLGSNAALIAALIWAVHPMHAETVAWVTSLKELSLGLGILVVAWSTSKARESHLWWGLVMVGALVAIGSKPTGVVVGGVVVAVAVMEARSRGESAALGIGVGSVLLLCGAAWSFIAFGMHESFGGHSQVSRVEAMASALYLQLQHTLVPVGLGPRYGFEGSIGLAALVASATVVAGIALAVYGFRERRTAVVVGAAVAFGAWLPVSNIVPLSRYTADSYMYVPLIGLVWMFAGLVEHSSRGAGRWWRFAAGALVLVLMVSTVRQLSHWKSGVEVWVRALDTGPEHERPFVLMKLGQSQALYGRWELALAAFEEVDEELYGTRLPFPARWPESHARLGNRERARQIYEMGLSRTPGVTPSEQRARQALQESFERFNRKEFAP